MSNGAKTVEHIAHLYPQTQLPLQKGVIEKNGESRQTTGYILADQDEQGMLFKLFHLYSKNCFLFILKRLVTCQYIEKN